MNGRETDSSLESCYGGVVPPIATPLDDNGEVDVTSLLRLRTRLVTGGVAGIFALGSTGEAAYLTNARRRQVVATLSRAAAEDGLPLLVGAVEATAARVIEAAAELITPHVGALVVTGPFYAVASPSEIVTHFETVAKAVDVPVLAYNIPANVGYELPTEVVADLINRGVIAGLKDSSANLVGLRRLIRLSAGADAAYFSGSDGLLDAALQVGANGAVAGLANVAPELFTAALQAHWDGDTAGLSDAQMLIFTLTRLYATTDPGTGLNSTQLGSIKTALRLQGVIASDQVSIPMQRSSATKTAAVAAILADAGVDHVVID